MKRTKVCLVAFLSFLLAAPSGLLAQGARDPHRVFRFNDLLDPNYYSRNFLLIGNRPVRDAVNLDSDQIIRDDPQSQRGFQAGWLQPGQSVVAIKKPTIVTAIGGSGETVRLTLKPGEAVVCEESTRQILSIVRCANKVIEGECDLLAVTVPGRVVETIEKPIYIERPRFEVIEKPVFIERPAFQPPTPAIRTTAKKRGWLLPVIIAGVGAGIVTAILLSKEPTPRKTYPRERVLSPP